MKCYTVSTVLLEEQSSSDNNDSERSNTRFNSNSGMSNSKRQLTPLDIQLNKTLIELGQSFQWRELLQLYDRHRRQFNSVNYATLLIQLGRCTGMDRRHASFQNLMMKLHYIIGLKGVEWMGARACSNIVHAMGKIMVSDPYSRKLMQLIVEESAEWLVQEGKTQNVSNVIWACAKLRFHAPKLLAQMEQHATWIVEEATTQEVANSVWACASLGYNAPNLFTAVDQKAKWLVETGNPQEISITAWANATVGFQAINLLTEVDKHADWFVREGSTHNIANIVWACGRLEFAVPNLLQQVEGNAKRILKSAKAQEFANIIWSCGRLGFHAPTLLAEVDQKAQWLVQEGSPQIIANTAWACATLGYASPFFGEIEYYGQRLVKLETSIVAQVISAFATIRIEAPSIIDEMDVHAKRLVEESTPQDVADMISACAILGYDAPYLIAQVEHESPRLLETGTAQEMATMCHALSIFNEGELEHSELLQQLWRRTMEFPLSDFEAPVLAQLAVVEALCYGIVSLEDPSPELRQYMDENTGGSDHLSLDFQREVSETLDRIGFSHAQMVSPIQTAYRMKDSVLTINLACTERMVAIECDGPLHFLKSIESGEVTRVEDGMTRTKRKFLERHGWQVINLNYHDWINTPSIDGGREEWLRQQLAGIDF